MASRNRINPGLGYRPQVDVEDDLIYYDERESSESDRLVRNLKIYLTHYYDERNDTSSQEITDCAERDLDTLRNEITASRSHCAFDYVEMLRGTECDPNVGFGYSAPSTGPCVLIKLNRIAGWLPQTYQRMSDLPFDPALINLDPAVLDTNVFVTCTGEYGTDQDAIAHANLTYYSVNSRQFNVNKVGLLPVYYYPYLNQPNYKSPLVFVHFKNLPTNQIVNVICRAFARNIDSNDKLLLRGMTLFKIYHGSSQ